MFDYSIFAKEIDELKNQGLYTYIRTLESPQGAWLVIDGKKVLNLCSNNYLGFANEERLKNAAKQAVEKWGVGPGAVRTIAGTFSLHNELEETLAKFKKVEATIFLQSGFVANQAVIPAITNEEDAILSDELNHASIIDGVRLSKAKRFVWKHRDIKDLEEKLKEAKDARRKLIITDGVFSMDGDLAPLPEIVELAEKYNAMVMVDDAHGEGVLGSHGRGIVDHFGLHGRVDIEIGTLSKAFGVLGGYIAGKKELIDYLKQKARPFLFSSPLSPADTAAALEATKILQESDERVKRLWDNAKYFKEEMKKLGFDTGESETPITPVMLYDAKLSTQFSKELFEEGIFAQSIGYPTVPKGKARIRVMISAVHTKEDLDFALEKFEKVGKKLGVI
ncbi:2-amino-3-ketobutyrate CoA ligase [Thermosipho melanesiensis]|uniref:8-amino-7-oxononanoate synthase n=2 Tax=Thermosipho melanesiensis TaxID=46541 RepID=BIOF_THEM4|nr:glycine C-acetyltransferase [Thermosipho melanesiensis]A6LMP4.1 RecName: Full=8-amino-7-oxononanoate synthase; Short=AONS; AltName: Full=7-keto-8-amino-pelargonic acid synthase; Short=7-KAP synthase; Short=KAPA synthase; AltName: Full=8-amino-7-ketopelargonate synthase [Thermosipho melanesiensis BI429]ABR31195.1 pyridoxal phosphate-dependent acyltransferase, putative [Thermosipho melanesiensis BI429]APT74284.1 2-amino-3-ketobutyrate CoA ligase [Thermosipho melanesiensis]OOC36223.1 2-amino-3-